MLREPIIIRDDLVIGWNELEISHAKSGGPGGQHVNKTNSKVLLRWFPDRNLHIADWMKDRIYEHCRSYCTDQGEILIISSLTRHQARNLEDCIKKFQTLLTGALKPRKKRKKRKMPRAIKERILKHKKQKSEKKKLRAKINY